LLFHSNFGLIALSAGFSFSFGASTNSYVSLFSWKVGDDFVMDKLDEDVQRSPQYKVLAHEDV